jgi:uncharacterized membrane protein
MSLSSFLVITGAFLASAVEMVEAVTIVLAMGISRGWRSALIGAASALLVLIVIVATLGPLLTIIPEHALGLVVGTLLLIFGLQWLRKAILRSAGRKALHDEAAIYQRELAEAQAAGHDVRIGMDWYAYVVSFKGVLLEGLEVAFIVLVFGRSHGSIPLAATGAIAGCVVVGVIAFFIQAPLSTVPENTIKYAVGVLLTVFGIFWMGEGVGVEWPTGTVAILWLIGVVLAVSWGIVLSIRIQEQDWAAAIGDAEFHATSGTGS